jgi:hypothetical protein
MAHRWSYLPDGTFTDGIEIWDYVRLYAKDYSPGTRLILRRPRLDKKATIATVFSDIGKGRFWNVVSDKIFQNSPKESIFFDNTVLPFEPGDELELVEQASPGHVLG